MPPRTQHDRRLHSLLSDLVLRLAGSGGNELLVRLDDIPGADEADLARLCTAGLLSAADPARSTICEGCERACPMDVTWSEGGREPRAFVVCDKRDDIGRVAVAPSSLRQWRLSLEQLATGTAQLLDTRGAPRPAADGGAWALGALSHGTSAVEVLLHLPGVAVPASCGLSATLGQADVGCAVPSVSLPDLIAFRDGVPALNRVSLSKALGTRAGDQRVALEVRFEAGSIVLVNHVTGRTRTLARPDLNSVNDNIFQTLFANPDRIFSAAELKAVAGQKVLKSLHKVPENLNFRGELKRVFFRVSANAIQFACTATVGRLATLQIDPVSLD